MVKKVAITGIGGYVGSVVAYELISEGHKIIGFGHDENFPILRKQFGDSVQLVVGNITDEKKLAETLCSADVVIHTASPTTEKFCIEKPWEAYQAIVYGTRGVARAVRELKIPLLIHFSTQAVYMNYEPRELPLTEEMELRPDTVYGVLKAAAERELADVPTFILRPANIYGKNPLGIQRENVISRFVAAAQKGLPLTIRGDGLGCADYVYLNDVVSVVKKLITQVPPELAPMAYNVGSGVSHSITEIARIVCGMAEQKGFPKPEVRYEAVNGKVAANRVLSIKRIQEIVPTYPGMLLKEGIREMFD